MGYYGWNRMENFQTRPDIFSWIFPVIFWMIIAFCVVALLKYIFEGRHKEKDGHEDDEVFEILRRRYAKGEITKREFEQMKKDLE